MCGVSKLCVVCLSCRWCVSVVGGVSKLWVVCVVCGVSQLWVVCLSCGWCV